MSDILLIQPPQWYPVSPYLAVPLLAGQLKKAGFDLGKDEYTVEGATKAIKALLEKGGNL